jgi:hypothetical protein
VGTQWLRPGAVYREPVDPDRPKRVLSCDSELVLYDSWLPHADQWIMSPLQGLDRFTCRYYATLTDRLLDRVAFSGMEPMTSAEMAIHQPGLPVSMLRLEAFNWDSHSYSAQARECTHDDLALRLPVQEIVLHPFGPKGALSKSLSIRAPDAGGLRGEEILGAALRAQADKYQGPPPEGSGLGLFRLGLVKGRPSYYLWSSAGRVHL